MIARVSDFLERYGIWLLVLVVVLAVLLSRIDSLQRPEAIVVALVAPLLATIGSIRQLGRLGRTLGIAALAVAVLVAVGTELEIARTLFPGPPLAEASVKPDAPDATLVLPSDAHDLVVEVHGKLGHVAGAAEGHYVIELERDGRQSSMSGDFAKSVAPARASRRRAPSGASSHVVDVDRHELDLPGSGPVRVHLASLSGAIGRSLDVRLRSAPAGTSLLERSLVALVALALVVELVGAVRRESVRGGFVAPLVGAVTLALYLNRRFSPSDPLASVTAALIVAVLLGGAVAALLAVALRMAAPSSR